MTHYGVNFIVLFNAIDAFNEIACYYVAKELPPIYHIRRSPPAFRRLGNRKIRVISTPYAVKLVEMAIFLFKVLSEGFFAVVALAQKRFRLRIAINTDRKLGFVPHVPHQKSRV